MRWLIEHSRYVVVLPAIGSLVGGFILNIIGLWQMISAAIMLIRPGVEFKESTVSVLASVDTLLLATVLMVGIGAGALVLALAAFTFATRGSTKQPPGKQGSDSSAAD